MEGFPEYIGKVHGKVEKHEQVFTQMKNDLLRVHSW